MRIGDTILVKGEDLLKGEIVEIDDYDRATVLLDSGVRILIHRCDFVVIKEAEGDG